MAGLRQKFTRSILHPLLYGSVTGAILGVAVALFTVCAKIIYSFVFDIYGMADTALVAVCVVILALICCLLTAVVQTLCPSAKGSGIPLAEGCARGMLRVKWLRTVAALIAGSLLAFTAGLPLGSEGPSVGMGGMIGEGLGKTAKKPVEFRRYLITGGASAGLAAAFNAPLTGICFAFEETHRRFSPYILASSLSAVILAVVFSQSAFYGFSQIPYLNALGITSGFCVLPFLKPVTPHGVNVFVLCAVAAGAGILCAALGTAFNRAIELFEKLFGKVHNPVLRLLPVFLLTAACGLVLHLSVGSGEASLSHSYEAATWVVFAVFAVRFITTALASGSGATGGLFLPMIAIGGLIGVLFSRLAVFCGMDAGFTSNVTLICVCAFFAASVRAPITAVALSVELTASFTNLLPCVIAVTVATVITDFTKTEPLYERMLEKLQSETPLPPSAKNIVTVGYITENSPIAFKRVRNIMWPYNSLVTELVRNGEQLVPDGETTLIPGDEITIRAERVDPEFFHSQIDELLHVVN